MRMISKITSEQLHLTKGKTYVFERTPKKELIGYLTRNDLGLYIKVNAEYNPKWPNALYLEHFTTLSKLRDKKLNDLGI